MLGKIVKVGVIGLGVVGLSWAVSLAYYGHEVIGVDKNKEKIRKLSKGCPSFSEKNLYEMLNSVINKKLYVFSSYNKLRDCDIVIISVDTPTLPNGKQCIKNVKDSLFHTVKLWLSDNQLPWNETRVHKKIIIIKSTVLPGTTRELIGELKETFKEFDLDKIGIAFVPEFLRAGSSLRDIFNPSRIVIGAEDEYVKKTVKDFYEGFYKEIGHSPKIITMNFEEAELVKYASNAFLSMKISFANEIADIADKLPNCDPLKVLEAVGLDPRIGQGHLRPGLGFGGPCLPKDLDAFITFSLSLNYYPHILLSVKKVNQLRVQKVMNILSSELGTLENKTISILGLAFKKDTDIITNSPSLKIIEELVNVKAIIKVHDPFIKSGLEKIFEGSIIVCDNALDAIRESDAVIVATDWQEYKRIRPETFKALMNNPILIDGRRVYTSYEFIRLGIKYYPI